MRDVRDVMLDKVHRQSSETSNLKMENKKLKVSDARGEKKETLQQVAWLLMTEFSCTNCSCSLSNQFLHNLSVTGQVCWEET